MGVVGRALSPATPGQVASGVTSCLGGLAALGSGVWRRRCCEGYMKPGLAGGWLRPSRGPQGCGQASVTAGGPSWGGDSSRRAPHASELPAVPGPLGGAGFAGCHRLSLRCHPGAGRSASTYRFLPAALALAWALGRAWRRAGVSRSRQPAPCEDSGKAPGGAGEAGALGQRVLGRLWRRGEWGALRESRVQEMEVSAEAASLQVQGWPQGSAGRAGAVGGLGEGYQAARTRPGQWPAVSLGSSVYGAGAGGGLREPALGAPSVVPEGLPLFWPSQSVWRSPGWVGPRCIFVGSGAESTPAAGAPRPPGPGRALWSQQRGQLWPFPAAPRCPWTPVGAGQPDWGAVQTGVDESRAGSGHSAAWAGLSWACRLRLPRGPEGALPARQPRLGVTGVAGADPGSLPPPVCPETTA